jgi:hypothetical protein
MSSHRISRSLLLAALVAASLLLSSGVARAATVNGCADGYVCLYAEANYRSLVWQEHPTLLSTAPFLSCRDLPKQLRDRASSWVNNSRFRASVFTARTFQPDDRLWSMDPKLWTARKSAWVGADDNDKADKVCIHRPGS